MPESVLQNTPGAGGVDVKRCIATVLRTRFRRVLLLFFTLAVVTQGASAAGVDVDTMIGGFTNDGAPLPGNVLILGTASGPGEKVAALMVRDHDPNANEVYDKPRVIYFESKGWAQFVALWKKARRAHPPARTNINGDTTDIGTLYDGKTMLSVQVDDDAALLFATVDADKAPMVFGLKPVDFKTFDLAVKKVSAYFR
jgi:hypothetical protein